MHILGCRLTLQFHTPAGPGASRYMGYHSNTKKQSPSAGPKPCLWLLEVCPHKPHIPFVNLSWGGGHGEVKTQDLMEFPRWWATLQTKMKPRHFAARKNISQHWAWNCSKTSDPPSSFNPSHFIKTKNKHTKHLSLLRLALFFFHQPWAWVLLHRSFPSALWAPALSSFPWHICGSLFSSCYLPFLWGSNSSCNRSPTITAAGHVPSPRPSPAMVVFAMQAIGRLFQRSLPRMAFLPTPRIQIGWLVFCGSFQFI